MSTVLLFHFICKFTTHKGKYNFKDVIICNTLKKPRISAQLCELRTCCDVQYAPRGLSTLVRSSLVGGRL